MPEARLVANILLYGSLFGTGYEGAYRAGAQKRWNRAPCSYSAYWAGAQLCPHNGCNRPAGAPGRAVTSQLVGVTALLGTREGGYMHKLVFKLKQ